MTRAVIIPARLASGRFPRKVLSPILGKPMLAWTYAAAVRSRADAVYIASGDAEILEVCARLGLDTIETFENHATGSDRVAEAARALSHDWVVNLQADEPTIPADALNRLFERLKCTTADMVSLKCPILDSGSYTNPNRVKVVTRRDGCALYFSRASIPAQVDPTAEAGALGALHLGVYGFSRARLADFSQLDRSALELTEGLEQLRALEAGWDIEMLSVAAHPCAVDVPEDLHRVEERLSADGGSQ